MEPDEHGRYSEISTVKDNMGPQPSLDPELEELIRLYIEDCDRIGIPRYQQRCLEEIQLYLNTHNIQVPRFVKNKPSNLS